MGTYKQHRKRKPLSIKKLKLRICDALDSIEPIFLEDPEQVDVEIIRERTKAAHAVASLAGRYRRLTETEELIERIEKLEQRNNISKVG